MSKIEETEGVGSKGNSQVQQYQDNQRAEADKKMILHRVAEKFGLDANMIVNSGVEPHQLKEIIKDVLGNNGSTEFNGEKKQAVYAQLGYNIDGKNINVGSHIAEAKGQGSGGSNNDNSGTKGDFVEKAKLHSASVDPLALAFPDFKSKQQVGRVANAYQKAGVEMVGKDGKATDVLNTLISISDEIDSDEVINNIRKNS
jgi:hypothetical protein